MEEILQKVKDENATGIHVEAISKEILQRIKEEGLTVDAMTKNILQRLKDEGIMVEKMSNEILQRFRDEEPIRESNVMQ